MKNYSAAFRNTLTGFALFFFAALCHAQLPALQWGAKAASLTINYPQAYITKVMAHMQGGVYVLGFFTDSIAPDINNPALVYGNQLSNEFISRYDANGNFLWLKVFNHVHIGDFYQDNRGDIFIAGRFDYATTVDLDPGVGVANVSTTTQGAFFFAKYDADLNYRWAKVLPSSNYTNNAVKVIRTDAVTGNIYIGGGVVLFADMDPGPGNVSLNNPGTYINCSGCSIGFYAKYDSTGALLWARPEVTTSTINDLEVVTSTGNIILGTGAGNGAFRYVLANGTSIDSVYSSTYGQYVTDAFTDSQGNLYFAGGIGNSTADFDWGPAQVIRSAPSFTDHRYFICKYDSARAFQWVNLYELDSVVGLVYNFNVSLTSDNNFLAAFRGHSGSLPGVGFCKLYNANTFIPEWVAEYYSVPAVTGGYGGAYLTYHQQSESFYTAINYGNSYPGNPISLDVDVNQTSYILAGRGEVGFLAKYGNCIAPPDMPGAITGAASLCSAGAQTYSVAEVPGAASYTWTLPSGWNGSSSTNSITVQPSANGGAISVAANNGCGAGVPRVLNVSYSVSPSVGITSTATAVCAGSQVTLNGSGATTYTWSNGVANGVAFSPAATAVYTVTGSSAGCSGTATVNIIVNANPVAVISPATVTICSGSSTTLTASGGATYAWSNLLGSTAAVSVSPTTSTNYTVTVTDANACSVTASRFVSVNQLPVAVISPSTVTICSGNSTTLTASGGATYAWSNLLGSTTAVSVSPTTSATYTVTVIDANTCTATASRSVTVNQLPNANINGLAAICSGLQATLTASGGTTYNWGNGLGANSQITVSPTATTVYTVTVTNSNNCSATVSHTISVTSLPAASISGVSQICAGQSAALTANGGNSYLWANGLGSTASITISPAATTTYTVTATVGSNCSATATKTVVVNQPTASQFIQTICSGSSYTFNGVPRATAGSYRDTLQTINGCDSIVTLNLIVSAPLTGSFSQTICSGSSFAFNGQQLSQSGAYLDTLQSGNGCDSVVTLNLTINNPTTGTDVQTACGSYIWIDGNTYSASNNTATYALTGSNGCDSVVTLNLTINSPTTGTDAQTACGSYTWIDGNNYNANNTTATYTLTGSNGCDSVVTLNLQLTEIDTQATTSGAVCTATEAGADYQWLDCSNNANLAGATAQSYTAGQNGSYACIVTKGSCTDTTDCVNITAIGIANTTALYLKLYPNPTTGQFVIEHNYPANTSIEISDAIGSVVMRHNLQAGVNNIDISHLAVGVYNCSVYNKGEKLSIQKVVKQ